MESKKLQEHLPTEKNKTNDSVTRVGNRVSEIRWAAEEQCLQPSFEGDERWQCGNLWTAVCVLLLFTCLLVGAASRLHQQADEWRQRASAAAATEHCFITGQLQMSTSTQLVSQLMWSTPCANDATTATTTASLQPLYTSTCLSRHLQLRTGGICWCKVLLPVCPCWRQPAHSY